MVVVCLPSVRPSVCNECILANEQVVEENFFTRLISHVP